MVYSGGGGRRGNLKCLIYFGGIGVFKFGCMLRAMHSGHIGGTLQVLALEVTSQAFNLFAT
jgi:hypothetical protein